MAIVRGLPPLETVELCERVWNINVGLVEIPIQSLEAVASLRAAAAAAKRRGQRIGVGTVTTLEQIDEASFNEASFTVAPGFDVEIAAASLKAGMAHLPGVATATEVQKAVAFGFRWMKVFPAKQLTPDWITAILAPFPDLCFVATGGIDAINAGEFLSAGARVIAVGSALGDANQIGALDLLNMSWPKKAGKK